MILFHANDKGTSNIHLTMLNTYDNFLVVHYLGQRPLSRKNMHFNINYVVYVQPLCTYKQVQNGGTETM